jgi:PAS domain-containing protein
MFPYTGTRHVSLDPPSIRIRNKGALRESEEKFRQLADFMPQMVWTARPDGQLDYYNRRWNQYTGLQEGYGMESWYPFFIPTAKICHL